MGSPTFMSQINLNFNLSKRNLNIAMILMTVSLLICLVLTTTDLNSNWMRSIHASPIFPTWVWSVMNLFGDAWVALLLLLLAERRAGYMTSWIVKIWLTGAFIVQAIKYVFPMPRPAAILGIDQLSLIDTPPLVASSMPSGHALAAISCGFALMLLLKIRGVRKSSLYAVGVASVVAAWSRVAVGAHWPADVIAGAGLAVLVLVLSTLWEQRNGWNQWFEKSGGLFFLIVLHLLIALHLFQPQSKLFIVQLIQLSLSALSIFRAYFLFKEYLRHSSLMYEEKS